MLKKLLLLFIIFIALAAGVYYFVFLKPAPSSQAPLPEGLSVPGSLDVGENLPQTNPFEGTKTNPFEGAYKNPFE